MSNDKVETVQKEGRETKYVPFGEVDQITLAVQIVRDYVASPTTSGKLPTTKDCRKFIAFCCAQRLNPLVGDCFMVGYDNKKTGQAEFSMITAYSALNKRAENSDHYDGIQSGIVVERDGDLVDLDGCCKLKSDTLVGGWARGKRKDRGHPAYSRIPIEARRKSNKFWDGDPGGQICKCAKADVQRELFPLTMGELRTEAPTIQAVAESKVVESSNMFESRGLTIEDSDGDRLTSTHHISGGNKRDESPPVEIDPINVDDSAGDQSPPSPEVAEEPQSEDAEDAPVVYDRHLLEIEMDEIVKKKAIKLDIELKKRRLRMRDRDGFTDEQLSEVIAACKK